MQLPMPVLFYQVRAVRNGTRESPWQQLENLFAFAFHAYFSESHFTSLDQEWFNRLQHVTGIDECFHRELER